MKAKVYAVLFAVLLLCGAVVYGAQHSWSDERAKISADQAQLQTMLDTRVEVACNILTVARRHLPAEDAAVAALEQDKNTLAGSASLHEKAAANFRLTEEARSLLSTLSALDTVQADARDKMYVDSLLPRMLSESEAYTAQSDYNTAAEDFNARLNGSPVSGTLAKWLGVTELEVFSAD